MDSLTEAHRTGAAQMQLQSSTVSSLMSTLGERTTSFASNLISNASSQLINGTNSPADLKIMTTNLSSNNNYLNANINLSLINEEYELRLLNFPSKREDLTTAIPLTLIFGLLLLTGCIGNLCTAIVIARPKNKYMHTATNYYLFSLAVSDFLFLTLGLPHEMYALWQRYPYAFGESFCIIRGYLSEATTYASILTISAFTIERYVAICHPLWAHTMSQLPRAVTSILVIWLLAAVCAIPPAAELGIVTQTGPLTNRTLEQSAQCATKRTLYENMFVVSAIVFFIVPMIIVTVLYILIAFELRRSSKMNSAISKQTSSHLQQNHHQHNQLQSPSSAILLTHHRDCHHLHPAPKRSSGQHLSLAGSNQLSLPAAGPLTSACGCDLSPLLADRPSSATGALPVARDSSRASSWWPVGPRTSQGNLDEQQVELSKAKKRNSGQHQPLSFHESLIQRHSNSNLSINNQIDEVQSKSQAQAQSEASEAQMTIQQPVNGKLHPLVTHQMSLTHSTSQLNANSHFGGQQQSPRGAALGRQSNNSSANRRQCQQMYQQQQQPNRRSRSAASSKKSVIRMLVAVVVSFFICWLPFHAQRLLASYLVKNPNHNQFLLDIYLKLTYISGVMYYLSSTINPLLYQLMSAKFRLAFKETFKCSLFKCAIFAPSKGKPSTSYHTNNRSHRQLSPSNSLKESAVSGMVKSGSCAHFTTSEGGHQIHCCCQLLYGSSTGDSITTATYIPMAWTPPAAGAMARLARLGSRLRPSSLRSLLKSKRPAGPQFDLVTATEYSQPSNVTHLGVSRPESKTCVSVAGSNCEMPQSEFSVSTPLLCDQPTVKSDALAANSMLKFIRKTDESQQQMTLSRLSSREEDEIQKLDLKSQMESLLRPSVGSTLNDHLELCHNLPSVSSAESGNSTGSSPDQSNNSNTDSNNRDQLISSNRCILSERKKLSFGSSSNGSANEDFPRSNRTHRITSKASKSAGIQIDSRTRSSGRRRRSLQQTAPINSNYLGQLNEDLRYFTKDDKQIANQGEDERRKSSCSSSTHRHLSSSLSSFERRLDKKSSLSTTTSVLGDCGSFTTTNSQLTGVGSNPILAMSILSPVANEESNDKTPEETFNPNYSTSVNKATGAKRDKEDCTEETADGVIILATSNVPF